MISRATSGPWQRHIILRQDTEELAMVDQESNEAIEGALAKVRQTVDKYSRASGYTLNPDESVVNTVLQGLARNKVRHGMAYCPCVIVSGGRQKDRSIICPCDAHKEDISQNGMCHCALYVDPNRLSA